MAITINWLTKIISVPQADLNFISGTLYEADTDAIRLELKAIEADEGIPFEDTHTHNTEVTVAGTTFARTIEIINGYSIEFTPDAQYSVRLAGSNNNFFDVENGILVQNQVQVIAQNSGGLIVASGGGGGGLTTVQETQLEQIHGQTIRCVFLNTENVVNGNGYQQSPFNNWTDANDDIELFLLNELVVTNNAAIDRQIKNITISSYGFATIDLNGQDLKGTTFLRSVLIGNYLERINVFDCVLDGLTNMAGVFVNVQATGILAPAANAEVTINGVAPATAGFPWILDMVEGGAVVAIHNSSGGMSIRNMTDSADVVHFLASQGELTLDASCTAGTVVVGGDVRFIDNSTGVTIVKSPISSEILLDSIL